MNEKKMDEEAIAKFMRELECLCEKWKKKFHPLEIVANTIIFGTSYAVACLEDRKELKEFITHCISMGNFIGRNAKNTDDNKTQGEE